MAECRVVFAQESRAALAAVSFLTRIPVPARVGLNAEDVRRAGAYFPLVGAGIGALTGVVAERLGPALGLVTQTVLTGALHLDALADSADSLGTRERERALEIMRDSRIGSFGAAAMCLDLLVKSAALTDVEHPIRQSVAASALSRAVPVVLSAALPYARSSGTALALSRGSGTRAAVAVGVAVAMTRDPGGLAIAAALTAACATFWQRKLGGVTGDGLGASIELTECALLVWGARRETTGRDPGDRA